jgi:N-acetyl-gamma-glutamyl-phosphate reductase
LHRPTGRVAELREREISFGLAEMGTYRAFAERSKAAKRDLFGRVDLVVLCLPDDAAKDAAAMAANCGSNGVASFT